MSSETSSPASTPSRPQPQTGTINARSSSSNGSARRQRVLWDSDSATRDGKTSISILLEWLSAPNNYLRWRDGKVNKDKGETREALCSEIKNAMRLHGINHRENANIRTQISELERSFDGARNWLRENNYNPYTFERVVKRDEDEAAVDDPRPAEAHVLRMCRYYHTLNEVFGRDDDEGRRQRRSHHSGVTYSAAIKKRKHEEVQEEDPKVVSMVVEEQRMLPDVAAVQLPMTTIAPTVATSSGVPIAPTPAISSAGLTGSWTNPAALESTQRMLAEAVREERERKRFCMEEERNKLECEKLRYEVEAAKLKLTIDRALARKKLLDAGLPETQVNELFPN
ncbi:hypothetical protein P3T76_006830 [Phytophthora citrophthora]|uniref:Uncharacterized protein n=1 Tax=Phytophthora citrophthora TaxID=4793 RepID=A0AAD9LMT7_9STRA|nr:hypothetical protein P3T76_006830 [Phytophthora citrophthora]